MTRLTSSILPVLFLFGIALSLRTADARDATTTKLYGRALSGQGTHSFGQSVAISDDYIVVGEPGFDDTAADAGAVQVFTARTGRYLRTLLADEENPEDAAFGSAVAVCDFYALIGAPGVDGEKGALYLFDLRNGRQLAKFSATDGVAGDGLGTSVALGDNLAIGGAPSADSDQGAVYTFPLSDPTQKARFSSADGVANDRFGASLALAGTLLLVGADGDESDRGAAYLFDVGTAAQLQKMRASDGTAGDRFGIDVAFDGNTALVGAPEDNGTGAAYLYRARTGTQLQKLLPASLTAGDRFGASVALDTHLALIGAPGNADRGSEAGAVFLFDAVSGAEIRTLHAIDGTGFEHYGEAMAICGNQVVIGAPDDGDLGAGSGSAYFVRPLAAPSPLTTVARFSDFAPGTIDTDFRRFLSPVIDLSGSVAFCAQLMGPGSNRNRDKGIWSTNATGGLKIATRSRTPAPVLGTGVVIRVPLAPVAEQSNQRLLPVLLGGQGVNARNQHALLGDDGAGLLPLLRTGDPISSLGDAELFRFLEILQTRDPEASRAAVPYLLRRGSGTTRVTARNDSGVLVVGSDGTVIDSDAREGANALDGLLHAQFFGRASTNSSDFMAFGGYVRPDGPGAAVQESFSASMLGAQAASIARQGSDASGLEPGQQFRTLSGEAPGTTGFGLVRAFVRGPGINGSNNEGIWRENVDGPLLRRGDEIEPDVFIRRILRFWPVRDREAAAQVLLRGRGINGRNDGALVLIQRDPGIPIPDVDPYSRLILLREGDAAPSAGDCPRIRSIQRIEVDLESGFYAITASLTGTPSRNQALFLGNSALGNVSTRKALRLPWMAMRKGDLYDIPASQTSRLRSILLEPRLDRSGVGGKGLGQVLNPNGKVVTCLWFEDEEKELAAGTP